MKARALCLLSAVLLAGCGDGKEGTAPQAQSKTQALKPAPPPAPKPEEDPAAKQARLDAIAKKKQELQQVVDTKKAELDAMKARHAKEQAELPDPSKFRDKIRQLVTDSNMAKSTYETMKRRVGELQAVADSKATGELKELRAKKEQADASYDAALSGWRKALEEASLGIAESPVQRELQLLREAKKRWFELTPQARSGTAGPAERKSICDGFRAWLSEKKEREAVVAKVLAQEEAGKGKQPAGYDFAELDFYILLELYEDALDRQNIAVENKQYAEEEKKLDAITAESESLRLAIAAKMAEGGAELGEYEDISSRLPGQQAKAQDLERLLTESRKVLGELETTKSRHQQEQAALETELEAARKALAAVR